MGIYSCCERFKHPKLHNLKHECFLPLFLDGHPSYHFCMNWLTYMNTFLTQRGLDSTIHPLTCFLHLPSGHHPVFAPISLADQSRYALLFPYSSLMGNAKGSMLWAETEKRRGHSIGDLLPPRAFKYHPHTSRPPSPPLQIQVQLHSLCISFLWLLELTVTNLALGQHKCFLMGLQVRYEFHWGKIRYWQGCVPFSRLLGKIRLLLPVSRGHLHSLAHCPLPVFKASHTESLWWSDPSRVTSPSGHQRKGSPLLRTHVIRLGPLDNPG